MKNVQQLVTHDGRFHADEVFSTAILTSLFPHAEVIRSRDPALTAPADFRIVFDVGGIFDPVQLMFDHHQPGAPGREKGPDYSSFGMIWGVFGRDWLSALGHDARDIEKVWHKIERSIVEPIDACDTGAMSINEAGAFRMLTLPAMIDDLSPAFDSDAPDAMACQFGHAVSLAGQFLKARAATIAANLRADRMVHEAIAACAGSPILELSRGMPADRAIREAGADHILFVVTHRGQEWTLGTVRDEPGSYVNRKDLPEGWGGLSGSALEDATGISGAVFCHKALFFAVAKDRDAIMAMAEAAVAYMKPETAMDFP